jgi:hypothetical protein
VHLLCQMFSSLQVSPLKSVRIFPCLLHTPFISPNLRLWRRYLYRSTNRNVAHKLLTSVIGPFYPFTIFLWIIFPSPLSLLGLVNI